MAKRWYIVQAYSNFERKVADAIREKVAQNKLEHLFEDVIVPTEKVVEVRRGVSEFLARHRAPTSRAQRAPPAAPRFARERPAHEDKASTLCTSPRRRITFEKPLHCGE